MISKVEVHISFLKEVFTLSSHQRYINQHRQTESGSGDRLVETFSKVEMPINKPKPIAN